MPMNEFKLPYVDTRLIRTDDTVYNVRVIMDSETPCDPVTFQREIQSIIRAVIAMDNLKPIKSNHLMAFPNKKVWESCNRMRYSLRSKQLKSYKFIYEIKLTKLTDNLPSNEKEAGVTEDHSLDANEQQPIEADCAETLVSPAEPARCHRKRRYIDRHQLENEMLQEERRLHMLSTPSKKYKSITEAGEYGPFKFILSTPLGLIFGKK